jgi:hypothetical protein
MLAMRCQRCGRAISPLRQLTDRDFCSEGHRRKGPLASASVVRDLEFDQDPFWESVQNQQANKTHATNKASASFALVTVAVAGAMLIARLYFGDSGPVGVSPLATAVPSGSPTEEARKIDGPAAPGWVSWLQERLPGEKPLILRSDFSRGLTEWIDGDPSKRDNWQFNSGAAQPGRLRLWKPTLTAKDYSFEFQGEIEKRGMSWAFRATGGRSYYGTKLILGKAGEPAAILERIVMQGGKILEKQDFPLPLTLQKGRPYQVTVAIRGNRFRTFLDGNIVDEWTDKRYAQGGVGFFSDDGEQSSIKWVHFQERKGILSEVFAARIFATAIYQPYGF